MANAFAGLDSLGLGARSLRITHKGLVIVPVARTEFVKMGLATASQASRARTVRPPPVQTVAMVTGAATPGSANAMLVSRGLGAWRRIAPMTARVKARARMISVFAKMGSQELLAARKPAPLGNP